MILADLFDLICSEIRFPPKSYIYRAIIFQSKSNSTLGYPPHNPPLFGGEEIQGDYFSFENMSGSGEYWMFLREHDSLSDLEETLIKRIPASFLTGLIAVVHGRVKHFQVTYVKAGKRKRFDKEKYHERRDKIHLTRDEEPHWMAKEYASMQVKWLD